MPKYHIVVESTVHEHYYIKADTENEAFDLIDKEPDEVYPKQDEVIKIELDDSLDEAEESDLKERTWNNDLK